jgi:tRNA-2-methylthio-N6-dimethylallyladenosine synthase
MGRGYSVGSYLGLIDELREARPELALSTDFIVGFPGESDLEFEESLALIEEVQFASIFAFKYSPRPGTAAPNLGDPVCDEVASARLQRLFASQERIQRELNESLLGSTVEVLVTGWGREPGTLTGRTACHRIVHFPMGDSPTPPGSLATVRLERALPHSLLGERPLSHPA